MSYKEDAGEDLSGEMGKEYTHKVWNEAIADAERKVEGYKRRIVSLRTTIRILRGLKKKSSTKD